MSEYIESPLETVRQILWANTDRKPSDVGAVMGTIQAAMAELGEEAVPFAEALLDNLDPHGKSGFGVHNAQMLDKLTDMVTSTEEKRVVQWGALSLLGIVSMAHRDQTEALSMETLADQRKQVACYLATQALGKINHSYDITPEYRTVSKVLLAHASLPAEDVATELVIGGLGTPTLADRAAELPAEQLDPVEYGAVMGDPCDAALGDFNETIKAKVAGLHWMNYDSNQPVATRDVYHDGKRVATVLDLTDGHPRLARYKEDLEAHPKTGKQLWPQLALLVAQHVQTGRAKKMPSSSAEVQIFYGGNVGSSDTLMRLYYTLLGKQDDVRVIGLVAAYRTKATQPKVLQLIGDGQKRSISES